MLVCLKVSRCIILVIQIFKGKLLFSLIFLCVTDEVYGGTAAQLVQQQHYSGSFVCPFNVFYYPFDVQQCNLLVQLTSVSKQLVALTNARSSVEYNNNRHLQIYVVSRFFVKETDNNNTRNTMIEVSIFRRKRWQPSLLLRKLQKGIYIMQPALRLLHTIL